MNLTLCVSTVLIICAGGCIGFVDSLRCYTCSYQHGAMTDDCKTVTTNTNIAKCSNESLCVMLMMFDSTLHLIKSVYRACGTLEQATCFKDRCYDKCVGDKCNNRAATTACGYDTCKNGAACNEDNGNYSCTCVEGYTGRNCETDADECKSNPCLNNGTCINKVNSYECKCPMKYVGEKCQVRGVYCYTCSYVWTADTTNTRECVDDPDGVKTGAPSIPCPHPRYCTTIRRFDFNLPNKKVPGGKGDIRSYVRMCDTVNRGNYCVNETNFGRQTCYSTCQDSYCNARDGSGDPTKANHSNVYATSLKWKELFDYHATLGSAPMKVASYVLVALVACVALLFVSL